MKLRFDTITQAERDEQNTRQTRLLVAHVYSQYGFPTTPARKAFVRWYLTKRPARNVAERVRAVMITSGHAIPPLLELDAMEAQS